MQSAINSVTPSRVPTGNSLTLQEPAFVQNLFGSIAARYDLANHLLSGGLDYFWRKRAARIVHSWAPALILDLATGSGDVALTLRKHCPDAVIIGADFCHPMLLQAQAKGVDHLVTADGMRLPFEDATFDTITIAFGLRNMASWPDALREMSRVLKPGGHLLILDFSIPGLPLRGLYRFYLHRILPLIAGYLTHEKSAYDYLADSIEAFPNGTAMTRLIEENGFSGATSEPLTGGIVSLYTGLK